MRNKSKFIWGIIFLFFALNSYHLVAQEMSKEQAFFYFMNQYNYTPSTVPIATVSEKSKADNFLTLYAISFDNYNYKQSQNDEFEKRSYRDKINTKLLSGINNIKFEL